MAPKKALVSARGILAEDAKVWERSFHGGVDRADYAKGEAWKRSEADAFKMDGVERRLAKVLDNLEEREARKADSRRGYPASRHVDGELVAERAAKKDDYSARRRACDKKFGGGQ